MMEDTLHFRAKAFVHNTGHTGVFEEKICLKRNRS